MLELKEKPQNYLKHKLTELIKTFEKRAKQYSKGLKILKIKI